MQEGDEMGYREDVRIFKALADENRLMVLEHLSGGEKCACVLLQELNISQSTLSHHMKLLCDSGLVSYRKEGKWTHYSLSETGRDRLMELCKHYTAGSVSDSCCKCE